MMNRIFHDLPGLAGGFHPSPTRAKPAPVKKPRTQKQVEASRSNGAKSRGPKTRPGKARSSTNAMVHGLASARLQPKVRGNQDHIEFELLVQAFVDEYRPQTATEQLLVHSLAADWQKYLRVQEYIEAGAGALAATSGQLMHHPGELAWRRFLLETTVTAVRSGQDLTWNAQEAAKLADAIAETAGHLTDNAKAVRGYQAKGETLTDDETEVVKTSNELNAVLTQIEREDFSDSLSKPVVALRYHREAWLRLLQITLDTNDRQAAMVGLELEQIKGYLSRNPTAVRAAAADDLKLHRYEALLWRRIRQKTRDLHVLRQRA